MRETRRLGSSVIVALLLFGGLAACSQSQKAGILLKVSTDSTVTEPAAITSLWVTVNNKMQIYDLKGKPLPGTLGIETSPGSKHILVEALDIGSRVLASGQVDVVAESGKAVTPAVVLTAVPGDAGSSGTGGAPGFDGSPGSDVPASTGGGSGAMGGMTTSGGNTSTGGVTSAGGLSNTGGSNPMDAAPNAGGAPGLDAGSGSDAPAAGGSPATGGATSRGGNYSAGGTTSKGGNSLTGGASSLGGATGAGGSQPTGGTTGTGGATTLVAKAVAAGSGHSCALINDGTIWCWGNNTDGQLGNGDKRVNDNDLVVSMIPVQVQGVTEAVSVAAGGYHTCAVLTGGKVQCWGWNDLGQLGNGHAGVDNPTFAFSTTPQDVIGPNSGNLTGAVAVVGGNEHTCAIVADTTNKNTVECWGGNTLYQLGIGDGGSAISLTPVPVVTASQGPLSGVTALAATDNHACAVQADGPVYCWGANDDGQLGTGSNTDYPKVAVRVGAIQAVAIGAGGDQSCAVGPQTAGSPFNVQCWGTDSSGEIGAGARDGSIYVYTPVHALVSANATMIALGSKHSCAVLTTGAIQCWGYNSTGQLGNSSTVDSNIPVTVKNLSQPLSLSSGVYHTCAVDSSGAVYCWGKNDFGQLGNGGGSPSSVPVRVAGF